MSKDPRVWVAFVSLLATLFLVVIKFLAYLLTGSLSILAESLHSFLDLLSTIITLYAVSVASRPPDIEHMYGHGKAENLGGLAEALLLIITSLWVIYEAIQRINGGTVVEFSIAAVLVMIASLIVDYSRSRALYNAAKRYDSQALEADALHYSSDLVSSGTVLAIVLYGLIANPDMKSLVLLDSVTASLISIYFARSSYILSKRAIDELMDRSPREIIENIKQIVNDQGIVMSSVRARKSGNKVFIDMVIKVPSNLDVESAHEITEKLENAIRSTLGKLNIDMIIHMEPIITDKARTLENKIIERIRSINGVLDVNDVTISRHNDKFDVRLHIETDPNLSIKKAHDIATEVEETLKSNIDNIKDVIVHVEPHHDVNKREPLKILYQILHEHPDISSKVKVKSTMFSIVDSKRFIDIICSIKESVTVEEAHNLVTQLENYLINELGEGFIITIHVEPERKESSIKRDSD